MPEVIGKTLSSLNFIGPEIPTTSHKGREEKFRLHENETSSMDSLVMPRLNDIGSLLVAKTQNGNVECLRSTSEVRRLKNDVELIKDHSKSIALLTQDRVAAFYQQLILAYRTGLHFVEGKTKDQAESAKTRLVHDAGKKEKITVKLDASHRTTIPCLYAYDGQQWANYVKQDLETGKATKPKGFVYLKGASPYLFWNSTLEMPKIFNTSVDNSIDLGKNGLRHAGIDLLNAAARGEISPEEGLKTFCKTFQKILNENLVEAKRLNQLAKCKGFECYSEELRTIRESLKDDPSVFETYLNIALEDDDRSSKIKQLIYQIRYKAIQKGFSNEARLADSIKKVKSLIYSQFSKKPSYANEAFKMLVLENLSQSDKKRLNVFFTMPYELRETPDRMRQMNVAMEKIKKVQVIDDETKKSCSGLARIQKLATQLSHEMFLLRQEEMKERGTTMRKLRNARDWTQTDLSVEIKKYYPKLPASQSTISRCETGVRDVNSDYAEKLSKAFKVDMALFMPQFFFA